MDASPQATQERVLVLMPNARDGERTVHLLAEAGVTAIICDDMTGLCREIQVGAGAVLLTDETIAADVDRKLEAALVAQPTWSALPLLILTREGAHERKVHSVLGAYNSVVVVERPVRTRPLLSAVHSALRTRRNQYHLREAASIRERQGAELVAQDAALRESAAALAAQAAQLRDADRRKDEFLATLAHELRNPLAPITAGLSLLASSAGPNESKTVAVMQRQVDHMVRLIDDLLDVSRITRGKLELKRERIRVTKVIEAAIESNLPRIQRGRHTLRTTLPNEPLFLDADFTRTAQIVGNLLNNAAKYTPDGGNIELTVRRDERELVIEVADSGLGIAADRIAGIFDMFGQVQGPLDRSDGGLGIGLALVRKLVDMHGGSVEARSDGLGKGSRFIVRLPLARGATSAPPRRPAELRADEPGQHVLIADDNQDAAELLGMVLEQAGYRTTIVYDGPSAIAAAEADSPHLIILDIGMGEMSGYEVAERMRKDARLDDTPLIALTGWGTAEDQRKAFAAGFDVHLTKPVGSDALRDALRRAAESRSRAPRVMH